MKKYMVDDARRRPTSIVLLNPNPATSDTRLPKPAAALARGLSECGMK